MINPEYPNCVMLMGHQNLEDGSEKIVPAELVSISKVESPHIHGHGMQILHQHLSRTFNLITNALTVVYPKHWDFARASYEFVQCPGNNIWDVSFFISTKRCFAQFTFKNGHKINLPFELMGINYQAHRKIKETTTPIEEKKHTAKKENKTLIEKMKGSR